MSKRRLLITAELGRPMPDLFSEFEPTPVAAVSIAQLHHAVCISGETVAVKVQRPGLRELVDVDIEILRELAELLERHVPKTRSVGPQRIVEEFDKAMHQELDFRREAASIERFGAQFSEEPRIKVPEVFRSYSTELVLTMEYLEGRPPADLLNQEPADAEQGVRVAALGADLTLKQIFHYGFFHADPHPGNIMILEDGRLGYLDFGLTGSRDFAAAASIEREMAELIGRFGAGRAGDLSFTVFLSEVIGILVDQKLHLPSDLFLLVKSLITIEGVATALDPKFDFAASLEPFAKTLVRDRYDPQRLASRLSATAGDYAELVQSVPGDYFRLVDSLAAGKMRFAVDEPSLNPIRRTVLQATSALVFAIVLASLIIGLALIVHSKVPPLWHQIPVIGIIGFVAAGLVGFWLLVKIIRHGSL